MQLHRRYHRRIYELLSHLQPWLSRALRMLPTQILVDHPTLFALAIQPFQDQLPKELVTWAEWPDDNQPAR